MISRFARLAAWTLGASVLVVPPALAEQLRAIPFRPQQAHLIRGLSTGGDELPGSKPPDYLALHMEFASAEDRGRFGMADISVIHGRDRWADVLLEVRSDEQIGGALQRLFELAVDPNDASGLIWYEVGAPITLPPPPPGELERPRGPREPTISGGVDGLTGAGVIIVIVDTGIDFTHTDLRAVDGEGKPRSNLLYLWDTTAPYTENSVGQPAHLKYPNGQPIGTIYSRDDLTQELTERATLSRVQSKDVNGHGTACAGIATGNGRRSDGEWAGVAPGADLIGVRVAVGGPFINDWLLGAICEWVESVADGRPFVISCSFGGNGPYDGTMIMERQLEAYFPPSAAGRAICIAAGNEADEPRHAGIRIAPGGTQTLTWTPGKNPGRLRVFFATADADAVRFDLAPGMEMLGSEFNPFARHWNIALTIPAAPSEFTIRNTSQTELAGDAYIYFDNEPQREETDPIPGFSAELVSRERLIGSPAAALAAITVGSYDFNGPQNHLGKPLKPGEISSYSNPGPLRVGDTLKPDITAPGQWFGACGSIDAEKRWAGKYRPMNGTSAATPYVAGIIALMLEKNPRLTAGEIRDLLHRHASHDSFTGSVPNPTWGAGKLDVPAVKRILAEIRTP